MISTPEGEILDHAIYLFQRRHMVEVEEVRSKVDASNRTRRRDVPRHVPGVNPPWSIATFSEIPHSRHQAGVVVADDADRSGGTVGNRESLLADARLNGQPDR